MNRLARHRRALLYLCALLMDMGAFCGYSMLFLVLKEEMEADLATQGLLALVQLGVYVLLCPIFSRLWGRDGERRRRAAVAGAVGVAAGYTCIIFSRTVLQVAASMWLSAVGAALFWPQLETEIGHRASGKLLGRRMGLFNLSWSIGNAPAPFVGGLLYVVEPRLPLWVAAGGGGLIGLILLLYRHLCRRAGERLEPLPAAEGDREPLRPVPPRIPPMLILFIWLAWVGNFVSYASQVVSRSLFQNLGRSLDYSAPQIGWLMALLGVTRTAMLLVLQRARWWLYRGRFLLLFQAVLLGGLVCLGVPGPMFLAGLGMALVGAGAAMAYTASMFYSVEGAHYGRASTGVHEAVLGSGGAFGLLLAGQAAPAVTGADPRSPFHACAALTLVSLLVQGGVFYRRRRSAAPEGRRG